jgi:hypothetical protein
MREIVLKPNVNKALIYLYTLAYSSAFAIIFFLKIHGDMSFLETAGLLLSTLGMYFWTIFKMHPKWCVYTIVEARLKPDDGWTLVFQQGQCVDAVLLDDSILYGKIALLRFRMGRFVKRGMIVIYRSENQENYRRFAVWWYRAKKAK